MSTSSTPSTILILGTGVFGLTAALAILARPRFSQTNIILVSPEGDSTNPSSSSSTAIPASIDSTRIIRADYADPLYSELAQEAHTHWREGECGQDGRYTEAGLLLTADDASVHGKQYVAKSLQNVQKQQGRGQALELRGKEEIAHAMRARGKACGSGDAGYINHGSGWADAEGCMRWLHAQVKKQSHGRVRYIRGEVVRLHQSASASARAIQILGAELATGEMITADLTILATGAWTPKLVDLRGRASSRAQAMAYYAVSDAEATQLNAMPVHLNIGTGRFFFPPTRRKDGGYEIKAARHAFGYSNPVRIPAPLGSPPGEVEITISLPALAPLGIPRADEEALTSFLHASVPLFAARPRTPASTRLCHYLDTPSGDFIVCFHPSYGTSLFLATGGSGHAFKFLPVLGDKVVDVLEEGLVAGGATLSSKWARKWAWLAERQLDDEVWCADGSRSGVKGVTLQEAMDM